MTHAVVDDVAAELGRPISTAAEIAQVQAWLRRIEATIKVRVPDLDALAAASADYLAAVVSVEAAAVARKAVNPEGLRSTTRAIDDGSVTKVRDSALSDGVLRITDDEWALITPRRRRGVFEIRPLRTDWT